MPSFGYEAEFETDVNGIAAELYRREVVGDDQIHTYHCHCDDCNFDSGRTFRIQSDSSCGGEVISRPFQSLPEGREAMDVLQEAALATDTEPGYRAGFHVHVGIDGIDCRRPNLGRALLAFITWEPTLNILASGRFVIQRSGNTSVRHNLTTRLSNSVQGLTPRTFEQPLTVEDSLDRLFDTKTPEEQNYLIDDILSRHECADRHSLLNVRTNHNTWEFRLWNSTRSAWRMQMYTEVSIALLDPNVVSKLLDSRSDARVLSLNSVYSPTASSGVVSEALRAFRTCLGEGGHPVEMLDRQIDYIRKGQGTDDGFLG